jgi:hypothetical protein
VVFALEFAPCDPNRLRTLLNLDLDLLAPDDYALFHFFPVDSPTWIPVRLPMAHTPPKGASELLWSLAFYAPPSLSSDSGRCAPRSAKDNRRRNARCDMNNGSVQYISTWGMPCNV